MQTGTYKAAYPKFGSLTFANTPVGGKTAEVAVLFEQIGHFIDSNAVSPEVRGALLGQLMVLWGGIYTGTNGKINN